jgi:probable rRNA maturation factor
MMKESRGNKTIAIRNRQRLCRLDVRLLRQIARVLLKEYFSLSEYELGVHVVEAPEMIQINEHFLRHAGSTDVITFDYSEEQLIGEGQGTDVLAGELFICVTEAQIQAKRYRVDLASELLRYLIHGILHLRGYDDKTAKLRRPMKREEDRLLREMAQRFPLKRLVQL